MDQEAGFFVRSQHRFSVPTWLPSGAARSRGQGWPDQRKGHRQRRLGLDGGEHGAKLGQVEATVDHGRQRRGTMATGLSFAGVPHHIFRLIIGRRSSPACGGGLGRGESGGREGLQCGHSGARALPASLESKNTDLRNQRLVRCSWFPGLSQGPSRNDSGVCSAPC